MDGQTIQRKVPALLGEQSTSSFIDKQFTYDVAYEAVTEFIRRTELLKDITTLTTTVGIDLYALPPDYLCLFARDYYNRYFIQYLKAGTTQPTPVLWQDISIGIYNFDTSSKVPIDYFTILESSQINAVTGTAVALGAIDTPMIDESILYGNVGDFTNVSEGDRAYNTTDSSEGYIISIPTTNSLVTAMLGGTDNEWGAGDAYVIMPQQRYSIGTIPSPSQPGDSLVVPYIQKPIPVYSPFRRYNIPSIYELPIIEYAAFLYKYKDREANYGDAFYKHFDSICRQNKDMTNKATRKQGFTVNMKKRASAAYSWRGGG
jgi:hypothetical protein